jgi:hypothetical protein
MSLQVAVYDMARRHFSSLFDSRLLACSPPMHICCATLTQEMWWTRSTHWRDKNAFTISNGRSLLDDTCGLTLSLDKFMDANWICVDAGLTALW